MSKVSKSVRSAYSIKFLGADRQTSSHRMIEVGSACDSEPKGSELAWLRARNCDFTLESSKPLGKQRGWRQGIRFQVQGAYSGSLKRSKNDR